MALFLNYNLDFSSSFFKKKLLTTQTFDDTEFIDLRKNKFSLEDGSSDKSFGKLKDTDLAQRQKDYDPKDPMSKELNRWRIIVDTCLRKYTLKTGHGNNEIGAQIEIVIPKVIDFEVELKVRLLLSTSLSIENKNWIQGLFDSFAGAEPELYQILASNDEERKSRGISLDDFDIITFGLITPLSGIVEKNDQLEWYLQHFERKCDFILDSEVCNKQIPESKNDPLREGSNLKEVREKIKASPEKKICGVEFDIPPKKVADLLKYPEFKIDWEKKVIKVGYHTITIVLPRLYYREATKVLYYSAFSLEFLGKYITRVVERCLLDSASVALVVALAVKDITAALAVFRVLFNACITYKIGDKLHCFFPELLVQVQHSGWKPV